MAPEKTSMPASPVELPASALRKSCDPASLKFLTTDELPDLQTVIGQPRAFRALELGSEVTGPGYNTFVYGLPGSGRTTLSREFLERKAAEQSVPDDWIYVNNFDNPHQPNAIALPAGRGVCFRRDMDSLIAKCEVEIPRIFESEEFVKERDRLVAELKKEQEAEFIRLQKYVEKYNFAIGRTTFGFVLAPAVQGKMLTPEDIQALSPEQRTKLEQLQAKLGEEVEKSLRKLRDLEMAASQAISQLTERTILFVIGPLIQNLKAKYAAIDKLTGYLDTVQGDIVTNADRFRPGQSNGTIAQAAQLLERPWSRRYAINLLVDNSELTGAPVIVENHPSYSNVLGRIEHESVMGATRTDFTMIQAGAIHRANGGYLIMPVRDLLQSPYAWEGLKRVLRDGEIRIIEMGQLVGLLSSVTLEPDPIPLNVKVILIGTPIFYYLLRTYDEDYAKLFKVNAEYATTMKRTEETEHEYGLYIKSVLMDNQLPPFHQGAVARIIEYSARMAEEQEKLSARFGKIADLVREAAYWAKKNRPGDNGLVVSAEDVQQAIDEWVYRNNLIDELLQELVADGTLLIDVSGEQQGQINALSIMTLGDFTFGHPKRVTASVYPGSGGVVDIERQARLGGAIHTKGVLILTGFLGNRYGRGRPLSLAASLTFEQSYSGVEGDSASAAELLALLSAIAQIPLRQDRGITGSINQHGQIQPISGVNEKVEGFYAACKSKGLTGEQGVILPASNARNLMLNDDVIKAVENGQFHIWKIETVDEAIRLLTGMDAGELQVDGSYPAGTFNQAVVAGLESLAEAIQGHEKDTPTKEPEENDLDEAGETHD
jgi:predicted ATP-dependent protease